MSKNIWFSMEEYLCLRPFLGLFFWALILLKWYQNTSGCCAAYNWSFNHLKVSNMHKKQPIVQHPLLTSKNEQYSCCLKTVEFWEPTPYFPSMWTSSMSCSWQMHSTKEKLCLFYKMFETFESNYNIDI